MDETEKGYAFFRHEVIAARQSHWIGSTSIRPPRMGIAMAVAAVVIVATIIALLVFGTFTQREHAIGVLAPNDGLATLVPVTPGTIERVAVSEGERVTKGQEVLVVSSDQDTGEAGSARAAIAGDLRAKQHQLEVDQHNQTSAASAQEGRLSAQLKAMNERQRELARQIALQQQRADGAEGILEQWTIASRKGVATRLQVLQQKDSVLQNQLAVRQLHAQAFELRQQIAELKGKMDAVKATLAASLSQTALSLADVSQALTKNAAIHRVILRAPFNGRIASLPVHAGQSVAQGEVLATVAPVGRPLIGELWLPSASLSRLRPGQAVTMRYAAARADSEGSIEGVVEKIAGSATDASRVTSLLGKEVGGARYRVTVVLTTPVRDIDASGLRAGMEVDAQISVERRRLIAWVIDPLYGRDSGLSLGAAGSASAETVR